MKLRKALLAVALSGLLSLQGCSTSWINTAIKDVPIVTSIVTDVVSIVAVAQGNGEISAADLKLIQTAATQATADLTLIQSLVKEYQTTPTTDTIDKIRTAIEDAQNNLQAILTAAHITNPTTSAAVTAAVGLALTTLLAIETLLPSTPAHAQTAKAAALPKPAELKKQFNAIMVKSNHADLTIK